MDRTITGKVAVITGATGGLGEAIARALLKEGAVVVLCGRSSEKLARLAGRLSEPGDHVSTQMMDVAIHEEVTAGVSTILEKQGRIDIWINNAGYGLFERVADASLEDIEDMMDVNYMGTVRCIKAVLPQMMKQGSGHIVNIASMAGKIGSPKSSGYSATKHAVLGFTNCLRQELKGTGIHVTAINPGPIDTPFFDRADPSGQYVQNVKWFMLKPERVALAIVKAVRKRRAEMDLPLVAGIGVKAFQLFPRLFDRVASGLLNKK